MKLKARDLKLALKFYNDCVLVVVRKVGERPDYRYNLRRRSGMWWTSRGGCKDLTSTVGGSGDFVLAIASSRGILDNS